MAITHALLEEKLGELQSQMNTLHKDVGVLRQDVDMMRREFDLFRRYANKHFEYIYENMATKADLNRLENKLGNKIDAMANSITNAMTTKAELSKLEEKVDAMGTLLIKVAQKVGVRDIKNPA